MVNQGPIAVDVRHAVACAVGVICRTAEHLGILRRAVRIEGDGELLPLTSAGRIESRAKEGKGQTLRILEWRIQSEPSEAVGPARKDIEPVDPVEPVEPVEPGARVDG